MRQSSPVLIYGLFEAERCLYVGRTRNPKARFAVHRCLLRGLPTAAEMRILKTANTNDASQEERAMIRHYRALGQATLNVKLTGPTKRMHSFSLDQNLVQRINLAAAKRNISRSAWLIEAAKEKLSFSSLQSLPTP